MPRMIFVNLPVNDLAAATAIYAAIGCRQNPHFSDHQSASMVWSDTITFQLLTRGYFATFTQKPVADAHAGAQVLLALTCDSRSEVDAMIEAAAAAGGEGDPRPAMDLGWLYNRTFEDADGHTFEAVWMDMTAMPADA